MALLEVKNMGHNFGGLRAVNEYNLTLEPGQITGLIGPNGAGKTTIFNLITGIYTPTDGDVFFEGKSIRGKRTSEIAGLGLARTFQEMRLWRHMTVLEHVKMARYSKLTYGMIGALFDTPKRNREEAAATEMAMEYLKIFRVDQYADDLVGNLPYGAQRRVEMARAMVTEPKVLFLDEPTVGMTPEELQGIIDVVKLVHERFNLAIFLIEHRLKFVRDLCTHVQALVFGELLVEGDPDVVQNHPKVIEAYLGGEED
ncbi:ABC transporter ATP-binding protein [Desulfovibrio ferrophilus]|uniref:Protein LivG4 n=1 Tax=Desulfovibrio ferrophilus TaxID=241368 RepID=A0A2Z6B0R1_9BACT|nr:ABC transporter ATP-binding protein [Desulfovibrio ferrophilus]BBD09099.1 protein LivG4 [Desulfovibrio ferrophilus]